MKTQKILVLIILSIASSSWAFNAEQGLKNAQAAQLRQTSDRLLPVTITQTAAQGVQNASNLLKLDGAVATLANHGTNCAWTVLDIGEASASGYAVVHVKNFRGATAPVLRLSYACFPEAAIRCKFGDFDECGRATYMTRDVDLPVLPANVFRTERYTISRTGTFLAPFHQPQFRYVRVALETPEAEIDLDGIEWVIGDFYDRQPLAGYFHSSDPILDRNWQIGVWTSQIATLKDVWGWRTLEGWLLPRKLEKGPEIGLCTAAKLPREGSLTTDFELRRSSVRLASMGLALFAKDADHALLFELDECGVVRWTRRKKGVNLVLREERLEGVTLREGQPTQLELKWKLMEGWFFMAPAIEYTVLLNGHVCSTFNYYHGALGESFGFYTPKNICPFFDSIRVCAADGQIVFQDDFTDSSLANWSFPRPKPVVADGAKRDRLVWSGDLWWAGRNIYYALADTYGMRDSIKLLAHAQTPEGYIHACPYPEIQKPASGDYGMFESDEFAAWFVPVLYDYWLYTADRQTLREVWPSLVKLMNYLDGFTNKDGLFEPRHETSKSAFSDCLQAGDIAHRSYMDILLYECRKDAALLAAALGDEARCTQWEAEAARTKEAIFKAYWQDDQGCFKAQLEKGHFIWDNRLAKMVLVDGEPWSMEANSFALAAHLLTPQQAERVAATVHDNKGTIKYVVMAARGKAEYGMGNEAWTMIATNNWSVFTDSATPWDGPLTTPEGMNLNNRISCGDQSHPDTALAGFISTAFLGIVPIEAGFKVFKFEPHPYAKLTFAEGRVPTPFGPIDARWQRAGTNLIYEFSVPQNTICRLKDREYGPGKHRVTLPAEIEK